MKKYPPPSPQSLRPLAYLWKRIESINTYLPEDENRETLTLTHLSMRTDEALTAYLPVDINREGFNAYLPVNENRETVMLTSL